MNSVLHLTSKRLVLLVIFIIQIPFAYGQLENAPDPYLYLKFDYKYGGVIKTSDFLRGDNASGQPVNRANDFTLELGWQATGTNIYDAIIGYPSYGIGYQYVTIPSTDEIGNPSALYFFMDGPFKRWNKFSLKYIYRLGLSYNWNPVNPVDNPMNAISGSYKNLFINFGVNAEYIITPILEMGIGFSGTHYSNGRSTRPNRGLNTYGANIYAKFNLNKKEELTFEKFPVPEFEKLNEIFFTLGHGTHQVTFAPEDTGAPDTVRMNYAARNLSICYQRHWDYSFKGGGGIDIIYWGAGNAQIKEGAGGIWEKVPAPLSHKMQLGFYGSFEWVMNNLSIYGQVGYRLQNQEYKTYKDVYQHLAIKYHFKDVIFGMAIRAVDFGTAEYLEWNLGYRIKWKKS